MLNSHTVHSAITGAAEANHRIANHLALLGGVIRHRAKELDLQKGPIDGAKMQAALDDLSLRVEAIGKLHKVLSSNFAERVGVVRLVGEVCTQIRAIFPPGQFMLVMDCQEDCDVAGDQAAYLGRIISEMLTNAGKYAHPTGIPVQIHVNCSRVNGSICVTVQDDGVGLPEGFDPAASGGLGFSLMRSAAEHLGGRVEFESTPTGLLSRVFMPVEPVADANVIAFRTHAG